ncbi:hypothetical protein AB8O64_35225 [Streptomyces sp. QH1-20]|uniref:hypothetical protein n=1 Tax=Streptomyces sp. QH1-20 TaxID=3240934 RepID=UPI0035159580
MRPTPARILRRRVTDLDVVADPAADSDARLRHFTSVMPLWTAQEMASLTEGPAVMDPSEADQITESCLLLRHLAHDEESLVRGPLDRTRQHWIGTSPHELAPSRQPALERARFIEPGRDPIPPSTKPFHLGLFTSTARRDGPSMWRMYLDQGSSLHPLPWYTWELRVTDPAAEVLDIRSAGAWADFVGRYPLVHSGSVFPDWRRVAEDYAGVHMTLRAIVATQGFRFPVGDGLAAAPYWDLESVLWLRWHFSGLRLVEITPPHGPE